MTNNKESTRYYSSRQEAKVAKEIHGSTTPSSGSGNFKKGDVVSSNASMLVECKCSMSPKDSFSIKKEWIAKNKEEAFSMRLCNQAIAINFEPDGENYYLIDTKLMRFLIDKLIEDNGIT